MPAERPTPERNLTPKEYGQRVLALQDLTWDLLRGNPMFQQALVDRFQNAGIPGNQTPTPNEISFLSSDRSRRIRVENGVIQHPEGVATRTMFVEVTEKGSTLEYTDQYTFSLRVQAHTDGELDRSSFGAQNVFGGGALEHYLDLEDGAWGTDLEPVTDEQHEKFKSLLTELLTDPSAGQISPEALQSIAWNEQVALFESLAGIPEDCIVTRPPDGFGLNTPEVGKQNNQHALYKIGDTEYAIQSHFLDFLTPGHDDRVEHAQHIVLVDITTRAPNGHELVDYHRIIITSNYALREGALSKITAGHISLLNRGDDDPQINTEKTVRTVQQLLQPLTSAAGGHGPETPAQ